MRVSEEAQARSHALQRQLELRAPQPQPQLAQHAYAYVAEGNFLGRAASPPLYLSEALLPAGMAQHGYGAGEYGATSWSEQESSPPAGGETATLVHSGYAPRGL